MQEGNAGPSTAEKQKLDGVFLNGKADLSSLSLVFSTTCQKTKHGKMSAWTHRERASGRPREIRSSHWLGTSPMGEHGG